MKKIFLLFVVTTMMVNLCYSKEIKINETERKKRNDAYNEEFKKASNEEIINELNKLLYALPKTEDEVLRARVIIYQVGKRNLAISKDTLKQIIKRGENSPNKFVRGFVPEIYLMHFSKNALLKMEETDEFIKQGKLTQEEKAEYLIKKVKQREEISSSLEEMAPNIVPKLMQLLEDKDERIKRYALYLLERSNDVSVENKIISMAEEEIVKPKYGLYFACQGVLENVGDKKAYDYLKNKLGHSDPNIREATAMALTKFYVRGVVGGDDVKNALIPLLNDKDEKVSRNVRFYLLDVGLIKEKN